VVNDSVSSALREWWLGGRDEAVSVEACVLDQVRWVGLRTLADELGGGLQSVHHDAGPSLVDAGFAESIAHLGDGELDAFGSFDGGELRPIVGVLGAIEGLVTLLVVKAVSHTAERWAVAAPSRRHDVAASLELEHTDLRGEDTLPLPSSGKYPACNGL
jgi:hypothetical protein